MSMENIIREHIKELEKQLEKAEKKVQLGKPDIIEKVIEVEKIKYAIFHLYACLGKK